MTITSFLIILLVAYALVFAIQEGKLPENIDVRIDRLRANSPFFEQLVGCSFCLGFWTGIFSCILVQVALQELVLTWHTLLLLPLVRLASSAASYVLSQITLIGAIDEELPSELEDILNQRGEFSCIHDAENNIFVNTGEQDYYGDECGAKCEDENCDCEADDDYKH